MAVKVFMLLLLAQLTINKNVFSQQQEMFKVIKGDIAFTISYKDTVIIAASNQLITLLDYGTGRITFQVKYKTFTTGIDSIDTKFKLLEEQELKFEGSLNTLINTKKQTQQKFKMAGTFTSGALSVAADGKGVVICIPVSGDDAVPPCKLTGTIKNKLSQLGLKDVFQKAYNNFQIDLRQSLLD